jgi:hypothetical protein
MKANDATDARYPEMDCPSAMVRIDRAMDPMMWYASKVGQTVELCRHPDHSKSVYWARDGGGYINSIRKKDAVLLPP